MTVQRETTSPSVSAVRGGPPHQSASAARATGSAGIGFVACVLLLPGSETSLAPVAGLELLAMTALLLVFVTGLAVRVRRATSGPESWSTMAVAAAGVAVAVKVATGTAGWVARQEIEPGAAEAMQRLNEVGFVAFLAPLGVSLVALGIGLLRTRTLSRWLAVAAVPVGALLMANGLLLDATFGPALLVFFAWTVVTGLVLVVRPRS